MTLTLRPARLLLAALTLLAPLTLSSLPAFAFEHDCASRSIVSGELRADALKRRLAKAQPAHILAIGSSSTEGAGASSKAASYPAQLQDHLRANWPGAVVSVENAGIGGEKADATLKRLETRLASAPFDMVIWQVGTNDAIAGGNLEAFRAMLKHGIAAARAARVEIALIDQQYFPAIKDVPAYERFVATVTDVAVEEHVPLFHRYALMKAWNAENSLLPALSGDRFHMSDKGYACLGQLLAADIGRVVGAPKAFPMAGQPQDLPGL